MENWKKRKFSFFCIFYNFDDLVYLTMFVFDKLDDWLNY